jgi:hypothetical protein
MSWMGESKVFGAVVTVALSAGAWGCGGAPAPGAAKSFSAADSPAAEPASGGISLDGPAPLAQQAPGQPSIDGDDVAEESERSGLGTTWGETRFSHISSTRFDRADSQSPFATASMFYNDANGAEAMARRHGSTHRTEAAFSVAGGALTFGLTDGSGRFLSAFEAGDRNIVIGEAGSRYSIVVKNHTGRRFEVVLSVDGLDVLDGRTAGFAKRGYLINPHGNLEVDGFRQNMDEVAAFRFGAVESSYAEEKHGDTRNVGVIGLAAFHELGDSPFPFDQREIERREQANPFPFATPPN